MVTGKRHKAVVVAALLVMVTVILFTVTIINAAPQIPHVLYGQARTQDGTILAAGLSIEARINNIHYGQTVSPTVSMV